LALFFRGVGGDKGLSIGPAAAQGYGHRLSWRQWLGMGQERLHLASRSPEQLLLPPQLAYFPEESLNRDLYFWLCAFLALHRPTPLSADPLQADLQRIAAAKTNTCRVLEHLPGLRPRYQRLATAFCALRPQRRLPPAELAVENYLCQSVLDPATQAIPTWHAPARYAPFLPVPLWGELHTLSASAATSPEGEHSPPAQESAREEIQTPAKRGAAQERHDPLILNRFDKSLASAEMVQVNRPGDDSDEEEARSALQEMDRLHFSRQQERCATRLRWELTLNTRCDHSPVQSGHFVYPEWDYQRQRYHADHCAVHTSIASEQGEEWSLSEEVQARIRAVRRQFEAFRVKPVRQHGQWDGEELDLEQVVRSQCDLLSSGAGSERIWSNRRILERDIALLLLVDVSLSTDSWVENRRVLDVEKEALSVLAHAIDACGDRFAIHTFSSRARHRVELAQVKGFQENMHPLIGQRIAALRPGYYTRIGAALRHATHLLRQEEARHPFLMLLSDGKPNDTDHYEGRHGVEDTRKAIQEARAQGISLFGITIDRQAKSYFPYMFGRGGFAIVHHPAQLSTILPRLYRQRLLR
ncbi:MAG: VWA domain-containing protein, partial [Magnetococcales bacterium]|nr:VWA domain-containing protein [Magnetococcales bacterium]